MKKSLTIFFVIFFITCCKIDHIQITQKIIEDSKKQNLKAVIYQTNNFKIFTLQKITDELKPARIYIEGDGMAFLSNNRISPNPTPRSNFLLKLVAQDQSPNIVYMARPCQFIDDKKCEEKYWTNARFSKEIIDSFDEVIKNFSGRKIELIGYSGGAMVALFIASKNDNIINLETIAGNLDHEEFTKIHKVLPLDQSLQNKDLDFVRLSKIPQTHFIGTKDKIIPRAIVDSYLAKLPKQDLVRVIEVQDATHSNFNFEKLKDGTRY